MKKNRLFLFLITLAGLAVRLYLLGLEFIMNPDGVEYSRLARRFYEGDWSGFLDPYWSPLFPFLMSFVMFFTNDIELPGRIISIVFSSLLPIPVFLLVRQIYSETEAVISAVLTAFYGHYLAVSITVVPNTVYFFLFALVLLNGWNALKKNRLNQVITVGVLLGFLYLTRPEAIGYVPIFAVLIWTGCWAEKKEPLEKRTFLAIVLVAAFFLIALPYLIYLRETTGNWTISAKTAQHLIGGNFAEVSVSGQIQTPPDTITGTIKMFFSTLIYNFHKQHKIFPHLFPPLLIFLAGIGLFGEKWSSQRKKAEIYLILLFLASFTAYLVTVVELVYMIVYLMILLIWTARGITQIHRWLNENLLKTPIPGALFFFIILFSILIYTLPLLGIFRNQEQDREFVWREVKTAGLWLKTNASPNRKIMSLATQIPFYAQGEHLPLKVKNSEDLLLKAKTGKADFIVIAERTEKYLPDIENWLEGKPTFKEVKEVFRDESRAGCKVVIYQVIQ